VAYNVIVELVVGWSDGGAIDTAALQVQFVYVEPGTTTAIELARIRRSIDSLTVVVDAVSYEGIFGNERLVDRHGALKMYYDRSTGVWNEREYRLGKEPGS
jgi:hypothetical protein